MAEGALEAAVIEAWRVAEREARAAVKREGAPAGGTDVNREKARRFLRELRRTGWQITDGGRGG